LSAFCQPAPAGHHEHALAGAQLCPAEERPPGGEPRQRERGGLLPVGLLQVDRPFDIQFVLPGVGRETGLLGAACVWLCRAGLS